MPSRFGATVAEQRRGRRGQQNARLGQALRQRAKQITSARGAALQQGLSSLLTRSAEQRKTDRTNRRNLRKINRNARRVIAAGGRDPRLGPVTRPPAQLQRARATPAFASGISGALRQQRERQAQLR